MLSVVEAIEYCELLFPGSVGKMQRQRRLPEANQALVLWEWVL